MLAGREGDAPAPTATTPAIGPALRRILNELRSCPAFVMGWRTDVLAWNRAATEVFGDFAALPAGERTWLRLMFADTPVRRRFVSWEPVARDYLAIYRATSARHVHDPASARDVAELTATSDEFRRWWSRHEVAGPFAGLCEVNHPTAGRLSFEGTTLHLHGDPGLVLSVETAAPGSGTTAKLAPPARRATVGAAGACAVAAPAMPASPPPCATTVATHPPARPPRHGNRVGPASRHLAGAWG